MNEHIEVWIVGYNPRYGTRSNVAYYDEDTANLVEIMKDLKANHYEIRSIEYAKKGSVDVFEILVV